MLFIGWVIYDAARKAAYDAAKRLLARLANDINVIVGAVTVAAVLASRAAAGVVVLSGTLDIAEAILRLRNVGARRDTSQENLLGVVAAMLNVWAKIILAAGLVGGGPVITGVGIAMIAGTEVLKLTLAHTNSLADYRQLLVDIWDFVRNLGRATP